MLATTASRARTAVANPAAGGLVVGIVANASGWGGASTVGRIDQIKSQTDAKWLREEFVWSTIEPSPGKFSFSYYDHFMRLASQRGEHVLPLLFSAPSWAATAWNAIPSNSPLYAGYVAAVVKRYGPHGSFWRRYPRLRNYAIHTFELWNEPYYDNGDNGDYNPGRYARLVKAAGRAAHAADPSAKLLLAAEITGVMKGPRWLSWIDALYRAVPRLNRYFDGVAIHPYGSDVIRLSGHGWGQLRRTEVIRQAFVRHHAADKPLWITEVGWPTCTDVNAGCVTSDQQATSLGTLMLYAHTTWSRYVKAVFVYNYDNYGADTSNPENDYSLTTFGHIPKPALSIFKTFASRSIGMVS